MDAAFIWGPNAGCINHTALHDEFIVISVDAPHIQWQGAIGFSDKQPALRDAVDAVLERLEPRIRDLIAKYWVAMGTPLVLALADAASKPLQVAASAADAMPASGEAAKGDVAAGKETFNGSCGHCHGPDAVVADRKINLRRLKDKYGDQMDEVFFTTVTSGRPSKGMPPWKDVFKHEDLVNILAYLKTVQGN